MKILMRLCNSEIGRKSLSESAVYAIQAPAVHVIELVQRLEKVGFDCIPTRFEETA